MKTELYKSGTVFFALGPEHGEVAELEILVDGGPICVAGIWDFEKKSLVQGLYWIYFKKQGIPFGPFYASLSLAEGGMRKALKIHPGLWDQEASWYRRQKWLMEWIDKNLGKPEDLIGGEWAKD